MSHADFVHLHLHTEYSLLDSACRLDRWMEKAHELKLPALAITDLGVLYGAIDFYKAARECLSLPMYPELTDKQVQRAADVIKEFFRK